MGQISASTFCCEKGISPFPVSSQAPLQASFAGAAAVAFLVGQAEDIQCCPCWSLHRGKQAGPRLGSGQKGCSADKVMGSAASWETCQNLSLATVGISQKSIVKAVTRGRENTSSREAKFCQCSMRAIMAGFRVIVRQIRLRKIV